MADIRFKERYIGFVFKNFKNPDSYLDYGSFNLGYCEGLDEEFADLTFRFDFSGKLKFHYLTSLALRQMLVDGECFIVLRDCPGEKVQRKILRQNQTVGNGTGNFKLQ